MEQKRNLKKFENQNAYDTQKDELMGIPHVVLFEDTKKLAYASKDPFNGYEYVDLGLPSGTLWATSVLTNADGEQLYFQWGDTVGWTAEQIENWEKEFYNDGSDYKFGEQPHTKYNSEDGKRVLDLEDDAAHVHMGGDWHMPTKEQCEELTANTTSIWTSQNGVSGRLFTSKVNSNSVFIPAFGFVFETLLDEVDSHCYVWSVSINEETLLSARCLNFNSSDVNTSNRRRTFGICVLGVVG